VNPKASITPLQLTVKGVMVRDTRDQGGHKLTIFNEPKNEMHCGQVVLKLTKELLLYVWIAIDTKKWVQSAA
jgi:hypothetical protein